MSACVTDTRASEALSCWLYISGVMISRSCQKGSSFLSGGWHSRGTVKNVAVLCHPRPLNGTCAERLEGSILGLLAADLDRFPQLNACAAQQLDSLIYCFTCVCTGIVVAPSDLTLSAP
jgi:hypothetical protein